MRSACNTSRRSGSELRRAGEASRLFGEVVSSPTRVSHVRFSLEMSAEAALNFDAAKSDQLTLRQKDSWRSEGIGDFLQGKYRPGLGSQEKASS
jgi:hypothetical protein